MNCVHYQKNLYHWTISISFRNLLTRLTRTGANSVALSNADLLTGLFEKANPAFQTIIYTTFIAWFYFFNGIALLCGLTQCYYLAGLQDPISAISLQWLQLGIDLCLHFCEIENLSIVTVSLFTEGQRKQLNYFKSMKQFVTGAMSLI